MSRFDFFDSLEGSVPKEKDFFLAKQEETEIPDWLEQKILKKQLLGKMNFNLEIWELTTK